MHQTLIIFPKIHFFFILQLCLAPFFNFFPLSDLKYNLPQISGKIGFFRENIGFFRENIGFFHEKSAIFPDFLPIFFLPIFFFVKIVSMLPENRFFVEKSAEKFDFLFIAHSRRHGRS